MASSGAGDAGNTVITTANLNLIDGGRITSDGRGMGNAGSITISASDAVNISGTTVFDENTTRFSRINSSTGTNVVGDAGSIEIDVNSLTISDGGVLETSTDGQGNAGNITLNIQGAVNLSNDADIFSDVNSNAITEEGTRSNVVINAESLSIADGASSISASTFGQGNAGNITLDITNTTELTTGDIFSQVGETGVGEGGNITLNTSNLSLIDGAQITAGIFGIGNAGNVTVNASGDITVQGVDNNGFPSGILNNVAAGGFGDAGSIEIDANSLTISDGGVLSTSTNGQGNTGIIEIDANSLTISDGGVLSTSTDGEGNAGNITLNINNTTELITSNIFSQVGLTGVGNGGNITLNTSNLSLLDGAQITARVFGTGDAGSITITAIDTITFQGISGDGFSSGIFSQFSPSGIGQAGEIKIDASNISIADGGSISAETLSESSAGDLTINASESIEVMGLNSGIFSRTGGSGNSGTVNINTPQLTIQDNAQIGVNNFIETELTVEPSGTITRTIETGGGDILELSPVGEVTATRTNRNDDVEGETSVELNPVGEITTIVNPVVSTEFEINLPANVRRVFNSNEGTGNAGTLNITAENINLTDGGTIAAISAGGNSGEINITETDRLTFRNNGNITATAAGLEDIGGDGGNISINANFIIAFPGENNNITANAFGGAGGNISIFSEGLLGIEERPLNDKTNDINVSSQFNLDGDISINILNANLIQSVTGLPSNVVLPEQTTAQACRSNRSTVANRGLTIKGKGGISPAPELPLDSHSIYINGVNMNSTSAIPQAIPTSYGYITPARGIMKTADGKIVLTATPVSGSASRSASGSLNCG